VARNLLLHIAKHLKRGRVFPEPERAELKAMMNRLAVNLRTRFMTEGPRVARLLADEKVAFRETESKATLLHFEMLRAGRRSDAQTSALHLDLLRDLKLINGNIVASATYPVLERTGELLTNRRAVT
jgi:phosphate:Na+ symporter